MKQQHAFVVLHFVDGPWALLSHPATPGYQRCLFHIHLNFVNHAPTPQSVLSTSSSDSRDSEPVDFTVSEPGRKSSLFVSSEAGMAECWDVDSLGYERSDQDSVLAVLVWRMMKTLLPLVRNSKHMEKFLIAHFRQNRFTAALEMLFMDTWVRVVTGLGPVICLLVE